MARAFPILEHTSGEIVDDLDKLGEEIGVRIRCQREEIFTKMHRI